MVHRLVVSYGRPDDPGAFDDYYRDTHAPLLMQLPGLVGFTLGHAQPMDPSQSAPYLVAELDFESEAALGHALTSAEGHATAADFGNFADGGVTMHHFDVRRPLAGIPEMP